MEALTTNYIQKAVDEFEVLMEVMNRPKRDMVPIAAVELIRRSMADFMTAFLIEKNVSEIPDQDLVALQKVCAEVLPAIGELHMESLAAFESDENFAYSSELDDSSILRYVSTLTQLKELVVRSVNRS